MDQNEAAAMTVLDALIQFTEQNPSRPASVPSLAEACRLTPSDADAAVAWLEERGAVRAIEGADQPPYHYAAAAILPQGRNLYREMLARGIVSGVPTIGSETRGPVRSVCSVQIRGLRGIQEGALDDLTPLVVLVGANGSGKSTVLDALMIGAAPNPAAAVETVLKRRINLPGAERWLFWKGLDQGASVIRVTMSDHHSRIIELNNSPSQQHVVLSMSDQRGEGTVSTIGNAFAKMPTNGPTGTGVIPNDQMVPKVRVIEPRVPTLSLPLHEAYSRAIARGRLPEVQKLVKEVAGADQLLILTEGDRPVVFLVYPDYAVPAALSGDGIWSLLEITLQLAVPAGSLVLIEEPEVSQHPGAIWHTARAIVTAVQQGVQVVVSTHSLDLIDALLAAIKNDVDLNILCVYRLLLESGRLKTSRIAGERVAFLRGTIEEDLR